MNTFTLNDIKTLLPNEFSIIGNESDLFFTNITSIFEANEHSLTWLNPNRKDQKEILEKTKAKIIICNFSTETYLCDKVFILVEKPKLIFLRIVELLFGSKPDFGIHPTSVIHPEALIHPNVYIGPFNIIGKVIIGENTFINSHCFIGDNTTIGSNVIIQHNSTIGSDGFGYSKNENGEMEKFPHIGGVLIEDNVEIGSNTCIDRGTLGFTILRKGAKVDNLVHIAHNVEVGDNSCIVANAMIGGSTKIARNVWVSPSTSLRDAIEVGEGSTIGMGAVLVKSMPINSVWAGNPAKNLQDIISYNKLVNQLIDEFRNR